MTKHQFVKKLSAPQAADLITFIWIQLERIKAVVYKVIHFLDSRTFVPFILFIRLVNIVWLTLLDVLRYLSFWDLKFATQQTFQLLLHFLVDFLLLLPNLVVFDDDRSSLQMRGIVDLPFKRG